MIETNISVHTKPELTSARRGLVGKRLRNALKVPASAISIPRRAAAPSAPLSFAQQRLWFIDQLEPGSPAYHIATSLRLTGTLNLHAFERAMQTIVDRHEVLRTRFPAVDGTPIQLIEPSQRIDVPLVDLTQLPEAEREQRTRERFKEAAQEPFNLAAGPLIRCLLVRKNEQEHSLLIVMHHIISDGWSLGLLFRELSLSYQALTRRQPAQLPELRIQYADYAQWQHQTASTFDEHVRWWKNKLEHAPASLNLPTDEQRHDQRSLLRGAAKSILIPEPISKQLAAAGRTHSATPFMMLLSTLLITLYRWSRQSDLVLGTVVAGRTCREVENLIGCFMNFLPIRLRLKGGETGLEILEQVKMAVLDANAHQDCPFDKIVEAVNPSRRLNQNPLYNVGFLLQNYPRNVFEADGISGSMQTVRTDTALLDLRFIAEESGSEIALHCEYDTELFRPETIEYLLESFRAVLEKLSSEPATPLAAFDLAPGLQQQLETSDKNKQTQTIAIAGTFTCEPLADALQFWMEKLELPVLARFAPYNQIFQQLLDPTSLIASNIGGLNVLLIRVEDWLRSLPQPIASSRPEVQEHLAQTVTQLAEGVRAASSRTGSPFLVCFCPLSIAAKSDPALSHLLDAAENRLIIALSPIAGVHLVPSSELLLVYPIQEYDDPQGERLGHVPYTPAFFTALGTMIARRFHALKRPPRKVIALDCDNTLWSGICGEDGPGGVKIDEPRRVLHEWMRAQIDAGMLLCLCSKNNPEDVEEVFRLQQMPLKREDFAACRLNWAPKSENLKSLARELNVGLDSFIFIDDNPIECAEVEANCHGVIAIQLPEDLASMDRFLAHLWILDHLKVTEEDRKRTALYLQNRQREQFQAQALSFADFLAGLNLQIRIEEPAPAQLARVAQLTERTNQFNFTTRRRSEAEILKLHQEKKSQILTISVTDRFGDYGLVGVVIYQLSRTALDVDTFLLSCRVLGKGVEHRLLARLGEIAHNSGRKWVDVHFVHSQKNKPAFDFLERIGASFRHGSNGSTLFRFPADFAASISLNPEAAQQPLQPAPTQPVAASSPGPGFASQFRCCRWIATDGWNPVEVLKQIEARAGGQLKEQQPYVAPGTQIERQLCELWQHLLHIERVGIHDDFFALGGTSLLAVRLFAQIEKLTGKKLPLVTLFRAPTIEQLANLVARKKTGGASSALVAIQPNGTKPPLVLIHGAGGGILWGYANLAAALPPDQAVYAIDPRWTASLRETRVEEMAERYLAELHSLQPKGPYHLGGYCFGGYVAYEMARQLDLAGEKTALLLLIDSAAPNGHYDRITWWRPSFLPRFTANSIFWLQDFLRLPAAERRELIKRKLAVIRRSLAQRSSPSGRTVIDVEEFIDTSQFPEDELKLWQTHLRAGSEYVPQPYAGRVTLLRTRRQPFLCSFDPLYGWGELAGHGVEVHLIPGSHENIFVEPDVTALAAQVNACLEAVQKRNQLLTTQTL